MRDTVRLVRLLAVLFAAAIASACAGAGTQRGPATATATAPALVLVTGATGGTGREVVDQALEAGYAVRALVRDEAKARALFGDRVSYVALDVRDGAAIPAAVAGVDYVISTLGSGARSDPTNTPELIDYGAVKALAQSAQAAGVKQFVLLSSMGVTDPDHMLNKVLNNVLLWKKRGEDALRATGMPYTIVRPGGLRDGDKGASGGLVVLQGDPQRLGQVTRGDVAAILVAALANDAALFRTFEVISDPSGAPPDWSTFFDGLEPDER
jgi:uncharacterized protein YbjT (DUF2867 family)